MQSFSLGLKQRSLPKRSLVTTILQPFLPLPFALLEENMVAEQFHHFKVTLLNGIKNGGAFIVIVNLQLASRFL